jgi:hypothetical protein
VPGTILAQLGNRIQHALRAFTPDDEKALRAAARTFPRTSFYDIEATLTSLGIGEALVTVLAESGAPSPPFVTRVAPPASRMGPLAPPEMVPLLATAQVRHYATPIDRVSAHEMLSGRLARPAPEAPAPELPPEEEIDTDNYGEAPRSRRRAEAPAQTEEDSTWTDVLRSPVTQTIAREVTRGIFGALLGRRPRRRRPRGFF